MALPLKVKPGDPIKASDWNTLIDHLRSSQLLPSKGVRVTRTGMGTILSADVVAGKGGGDSLHPLQLVNYTDPQSPTARKFRVMGGYVAGLLPTPMVAGDDPPCVFDGGTSETVVYAEVSVDSNNNYTGAAIRTGECPANTSGKIYLTIGSVKFVDGNFNTTQNVGGSVYPVCVYNLASDILGATWRVLA